VVYTILKKLRKEHDITLDEVAVATKLSIGYINRIERGYITEIKNEDKRKRLETYIKNIERKTKREISLS
jgi:transcriptional regulator with XRE-family HTH domain